VSLLAEVRFGREVCGQLEAAETCEWLVTNGLGGFASGTVAGTATRRYHGLLIAALEPPTARTLLVSGVEESASYLGGNHSLATNRWLSGFVSPQGYLQLESFFLEGTKPVWQFAMADALLEKRVWMKQGENTTYVEYSLVRASGPVELQAKALVGYRDFHATTHADGWQMRIEPVENGLCIMAFDRARPFYLLSRGARIEPRHEWYRDYFLPAERQRGLDDHEDRLYVGLFHLHLKAGESVTLVFSTEQGALLDGEEARNAQCGYERKLFCAWEAKHAEACPTPAEQEPEWLRQLVLAADQFVVQRTPPEDLEGRSVIAGYPWFNDWGRDTMIALPGLTLVPGRPEVARKILKSFAQYIDRGMLPNNFPERNGEVQYNTVDAGLWYFEAVRQYFQSTRDLALLSELYPVLAGIVDAHVRGTRYNIKVDPGDALLFAGSPDVQLTWMDSKIGDCVVTPRTGKAVEINALWINALHTMMGFARTLVRPAEGYAKLAEKATKNFQKFWNAERECCYDVIDVPAAGNDPSLRPNQIFAVSLPFSPLGERQQKCVVDVVAQHLVTSYGLRSLAPGEPGYQGKYAGGPRERDSAYHQGTVWAWLLGPFALAHFRVYGDSGVAKSFLEPLGRSMHSAGLGTLSEIFGGDAPFPPAGCIAQAWSVAELFRAWEFLSTKRDLSQKVVLQGT
jgi:predicted glycogen debranching enzyme